MQRGENQVARLGGFEGNFDGFLVAHFADENYFGRLAQGGAQSEREARRVGVQFALMDRGSLVSVQEFDGVFDGDDVERFLFIDLVENRGERGGFSAAGRAGDEHDAVPQIRRIPQAVRAVAAS